MIIFKWDAKVEAIIQKTCHELFQHFLAIGYNMPTKIELPSGTSGFSIPLNPKPQRGRPRKLQGAVAAGKPTLDLPMREIQGARTEPKKKKRGRPKKKPNAIDQATSRL